eukprot:comp19869_c0_seq1/m.24017 comp19869_c0_seq1/g.24017  ORF comp19869_c0_seq1/g.24017 comp19869_c0_seq1/m.24017 type:complete len:391 (-) comp19869_c0_seq1:378-1550(-)
MKNTLFLGWLALLGFALAAPQPSTVQWYNCPSVAGTYRKWCEAQLDVLMAQKADTVAWLKKNPKCKSCTLTAPVPNPLRCLCGQYASTGRSTQWTDKYCQAICNQPDGDYICPPQYCKCNNAWHDDSNQRCEALWYDRWGNSKLAGWDFSSCSKFIPNPGTTTGNSGNVDFCDNTCMNNPVDCICSLCICKDLFDKYCTCEDTQIDVVILIDRSGSVGGQLNDMKSLSKQMVEELKPKPNAKNIGLVQFGDNADNLVVLGDPSGDYANEAALKAAIDTITVDGGTNMLQGFQKALGQLIPGGVKYRPGAPDFIIILTDGEPNTGGDKTAVLNYVNTEIKPQGIQIAAMGVGSVDITFLNNLTGDPSLVFTAATFDDMKQFIDKIVGVVCS